MESVESKPPFLQLNKRRFSSGVGYIGEWATPMIAWVVVSGIVLAVVCVAAEKSAAGKILLVA